MIRRNTRLRWLTGLAAGAIAITITGHAALTDPPAETDAPSVRSASPAQ